MICPVAPVAPLAPLAPSALLLAPLLVPLAPPFRAIIWTVTGYFDENGQEHPEGVLRLLFIGDIVGRPGRDLIRKGVRSLIERYRLDLVIANAENAAAGRG